MELLDQFTRHSETVKLYAPLTLPVGQALAIALTLYSYCLVKYVLAFVCALRRAARLVQRQRVREPQQRVVPFRPYGTVQYGLR